jgi:Cation efflux system protein CusB domain 1
MQAELLAPSTSIGFLRPGQRVLLRYSAFPYQKFGEYWGTVTEISRAALQTEELKALVPSMPAAEQAKTFYRVTVAPRSARRHGVRPFGASPGQHASRCQRVARPPPDLPLDSRAALRERRSI